MTEKVNLICETGHPLPSGSFASPQALGQWTARALEERLNQGKREIRLPCWADLGPFSPAAGALAVLRAVMETVYAHPELQSLTLVCPSPEALSVFRFQWNMWFAATKPPHES